MVVRVIAVVSAQHAGAAERKRADRRTLGSLGTTARLLRTDAVVPGSNQAYTVGVSGFRTAR